MAEPIVKQRFFRGVRLFQVVGDTTFSDIRFAANLLLDLLQAGRLIWRFTDRKQVPALGVEQEQQPVQQGQGRLENVGQVFLGWLLLLAEALLAIHQEALRQVRKNLEEDAVFEPLSEALGIVPTALKDGIEPAPKTLGARPKGVWSKE